MALSLAVLKRFPSRMTKIYKSAAILSSKYFKDVADMERVSRLLESISSLQGPSVEFMAENKWDYTKKGTDWSDLCPFGPTQSPVKINSEDSYPASQCFIEKYYPLDLHYSPITTRGRFTKRVYILHGDYGQMHVFPPREKTPRIFDSVQFHFHAPSEHVVDSQSYDLELHLVHKDLKKGTVNAVLGILFKNTGKFNPFIQLSIDSLEKPVEIDIGSLLEKEPQFYFYHGSLTTPPCSENVLWFLMTKPLEMDEKQLKFFTSRWSENKGFAEGKGNNRDVQPLYNRPVLHFDDQDCMH
ncbi:hypothetical protein SteCoe_19837 [Stentor coeruleus]|uniref:Carbonic anhydrase n=1 Tax=Stentor coeruleus TaxID=5963 RepID=A0A1R2BTD8_9CILI|nr:hypothetical protein SteCoe_19837 [Stentor coeruleus]